MGRSTTATAAAAATTNVEFCNATEYGPVADLPVSNTDSYVHAADDFAACAIGGIIFDRSAAEWNIKSSVSNG